MGEIGRALRRVLTRLHEYRVVHVVVEWIKLIQSGELCFSMWNCVEPILWWNT